MSYDKKQTTIFYLEFLLIGLVIFFYWLSSKIFEGIFYAGLILLISQIVNRILYSKYLSSVSIVGIGSISTILLGFGTYFYSSNDLFRTMIFTSISIILTGVIYISVDHS